MRRAALAVVLGACGFSATNTAPGSSEARVDAGLDAATDAPAPAFCADTARGHVIACMELEGNADDGSHHLTAHANLTYGPGVVGQAAMFTGTASMADYDDSPALDVASVTVEMWVRVTALPSDGTYLLDANDQYALQFKNNGGLHCTMTNSQPLDTDNALDAGTWHHIACTSDAATGDSFLYVDGSERNSGHNGKPLSTKGTTGMSLAANNPAMGDRQQLTGMLDQVRILDYARSGAEICADAGATSCP